MFYVLYFYGFQFLFSEGGHKGRLHDGSNDYVLNSANAWDCSVHSSSPLQSLLIKIYRTIIYVCLSNWFVKLGFPTWGRTYVRVEGVRCTVQAYNPYRSNVELNSALFIVLSPVLNLNRHVILQCFMLTSKLLLFSGCFSTLKIRDFLENLFGHEHWNSQ